MPDFSPQLVQDNLHGSRLRGPIHYQAATSSSNDSARALALAGEAEGAVVVAGEQTAGRGRRGRTWHARPGQALLFSLLLRPTARPVSDWPLLCTAMGVAAAEACARCAPGPFQTKWPNDLVCGGRKLGGILLEARAPEFLVLGMGLNLYGETASLPAEVRDLATTVEAASDEGVRVPAELLLAAVLNCLDGLYGLWLAGETAALIDRARRLESTLGKALLVKRGGEELRGTAMDLTPAGGLLLRSEGGDVVLEAGEVQSVRAGGAGAA